MPIDTNEDQAPYWNDINIALADNYHQILFKPSVAVQARELTQIQDILQNQIERFGDNIFVTGTVIKGCNFNFDTNYTYAKINDIRPIDGEQVNPAEYVGLLAYESTSNLYAVCVNYQTGFQAQDPNLNTLYLKYVNSGANNQQAFASGSTLQFFSNVNPAYANTTNYIANADLQIATTANSVGAGYLMSVGSGIIYQKGHFVHVANNTSAIVSKYSNLPDGVVAGFNIQENIVTADQDPSLYDQSAGYTNYNAPGADRLQLLPVLSVYPTNATPNAFFTLVEWDAGNITKSFQQTEYSDIGNDMARRTYESEGDFFVNPFRIHAESSNTTYNSMVASAGLAYIEGHRVEQLNNIRTPIRKGLDIKTSVNQVLNTDFDNSVLVQQFIGAFSTNSGNALSLLDTAQNAISNDQFSTSYTGNIIGTAELMSVTYDNGQVGTATGQYRLYLANINMNAGKTFANVKSVHSQTGGLADIVLSYSQTSNSYIAQLSQPSKSSWVFPTAKVGSYSLSGTGTLPNFIYRSSVNSIVNYTTGNSNVIQLTGTNKFPYGQGNVSSTEVNDFVVVPISISGGGTYSNVTLATTGNASINATSNVVMAAAGNTTAFTSEYQVGDYININGVARRITNISNSSYMTTDNIWAINEPGLPHAKCYPVNVPINFAQRNSYASIIDVNNQQLQFSLLAANGASETLSANMNIVVGYNAIVPSDGDRALQANTSLVTRINTSNNINGSTGPWCLGVPYVYNIRNVYKSSNVGTFVATSSSGNAYLLVANTSNLANGVSIFGSGIPVGTSANVINSTALIMSSPATANSSNATFNYGYYSNAASDDITFAFTLNDGQKDAFFDLSFLNKNPNYPNIGISPIDLITVVFDAFLPQNTGKGYISVDSYTSIISTTGLFGYESIPTFTDSAGNYYELRDSIDFRSFASNTAAYQTVLSNSVINPVYSSTLPVGENYLAAPNQTFIYNIEYYLGRIDKLMLNSYGDYSIVEGTPSENPVAPADKADTVTLAVINVPPYPSLAQTVFTTNVAQDYLLSVDQSQMVQAYTMQDIAALDTRLTNLEYYVSLNLLETNAAAMSIASSVTGANRFKNGIFVDNFSTTDSLDLTNPEFRAALSSTEDALVPRVSPISVNLNYASGNNVNENGNLLTLSGNGTISLIDQIYASNTRNASESAYIYNGTSATYPSYCSLPDLTSTANTPTTSPYVSGQLAATITYVNSSLGTFYQGYTGTGSVPAGLVQLQYGTETQEASVLQSYFGTTGLVTSGITRSYTMTQKGYFIAPETGAYTFHIMHDDGIALQIGSSSWSYPSSTPSTLIALGPVSLVAGQYYPFSITYGPTCGGGGGPSDFRQDIFWFSVNSNVYSQFYYASTSTGAPYAINPTKSITSTMFARDTVTVQTGSSGNTQYNNTLPTSTNGGLNINIAGLVVDSSISVIPTSSISVLSPALTTSIHVLSILSNKG